MRTLLIGVAAAMLIVGAPGAQAQTDTPQTRGLIFAIDRGVDRPALDRVQFVFGGRNYCWYDGGWRGPGWYWCGYAWRHGLGWGGGVGWNGWRGGHRWGHHHGGHWGHHGGHRGGHGGHHGGGHGGGHRR